jgi:hypothetical protein
MAMATLIRVIGWHWYSREQWRKTDNHIKEKPVMTRFTFTGSFSGTKKKLQNPTHPTTSS